MFETINNWVVTYMDTPHYQIVTRFKKFVDNAAEKEAKYKEEEILETQEPTQEAETKTED